MLGNKGGIGIILFFSALFLVLIFGFIAAMGWTIVDYASDTITPIMEDLGMVGDANVSQAASYSFTKLDTIIESSNWIIAITYLLAIIFTLVFIFVSGYQPHPAYMGFFVAMMILLILGCVVMSNMYQDIYSVDDEIGNRLREQGITSHLILYSPMIMSLIAVVGGIIMFARQSNSEGGGAYGL